MSHSLLQTSRQWHRKIASLLFVFFFLISITGLMLGWKSIFTKIIFDNKKVTPSAALQKWLPLDSLEIFASVALYEKTKNEFKHAESIQLRPAKGYINFIFKNNYNVQVDGATGTALHIEQKYGGLIQDIHDGAFVDGLFSSSAGLSKKIYTSVIGLALLFLTVSGFYLWYKPRQIKLSKK
jgi:uncharacterized iron-regulated membrane protein